MYEAPKRRKLSKSERQTVYDKCGGHCAYCGTPMEITQMQVDHVKPISLFGGKDTFDNMLPSCRSCNHYKHSLQLEKFREAIEQWPEVLMRDSVTYKNAVRYGIVIPNPKRVKFYFETMEVRNGD